MDPDNNPYLFPGGSLGQWIFTIFLIISPHIQVAYTLTMTGCSPGSHKKTSGERGRETAHSRASNMCIYVYTQFRAGTCPLRFHTFPACVYRN